MSTNYDYYGNDEAVCPYCDYEESDSWEIAGDTREEKVLIECGNCDKQYLRVDMNDSNCSMFCREK